MGKKKGYKDKVEKLAEKVRPGEVAEATVYHEYNCGIWEGRECDCTPDIVMIQRDQ